MRGELHAMMMEREWRKARAVANPDCSAQGR